MSDPIDETPLDVNEELRKAEQRLQDYVFGVLGNPEKWKGWDDAKKSWKDTLQAELYNIGQVNKKAVEAATTDHATATKEAIAEMQTSVRATIDEMTAAVAELRNEAKALQKLTEREDKRADKRAAKHGGAAGGESADHDLIQRLAADIQAIRQQLNLPVDDGKGVAGVSAGGQPVERVSAPGDAGKKTLPHNFKTPGLGLPKWVLFVLAIVGALVAALLLAFIIIGITKTGETGSSADSVVTATGPEEPPTDTAGAPKPEPDPPYDAEAGGWRALISGSPVELKTALCVGDPNGACELNTVKSAEEPFPKGLALQAAAAAVNEKHACGAALVGRLDGIIGEKFVNSFNAIAECMSKKPSTCSKDDCAPPDELREVSLENKAEWEDGSLNWLLNVLGAQE